MSLSGVVTTLREMKLPKKAAMIAEGVEETLSY